MQDKDFDKLFNSKFEDFEVEPSPIVWKNITNELEGKKTAMPWMTYLGMAATVAVVFTAGWLFLRGDSQSGQKHHNYANLVNHRSKPQTTPVVKLPEPLVSDSASANNDKTETMASNNNHQHKTISPVNKATEPVTNKTDGATKEPQQEINTNQQLIAQTTAPATAPAKLIIPDVQLSPKTIDAVAATPVEKPVTIITTEKETEETTPKRGIHNLGGLINALVSKVDKRPHKFIEFSDEADDDAETNLTAVNMGPLKFKKQ